MLIACYDIQYNKYNITEGTQIHTGKHEYIHPQQPKLKFVFKSKLYISSYLLHTQRSGMISDPWKQVGPVD